MIELRRRLENASADKNKNIVWTEATHPLFQDRPQRLRALIALGLGCDVFDGVDKCGPAKIESQLKKIKEKNPDSITESFQSFLENELTKNRNKKKKKEIDFNDPPFSDGSSGLINTMMEAFLYEPGVVVEEISPRVTEVKSREGIGNNMNVSENDDEDKDGRLSDDDCSSSDSEESGMSEEDAEEIEISRHSRHPYVTEYMPTSLSKYVKCIKTSNNIQIENGARL